MNNLNFSPVVLSEYIKRRFLEIESDVLNSGALSWAPYSNNTRCSDGLFRIPTCSNGAGQLLVILYYLEVKNVKRVFYPKNTFEGIKNTYKFLSDKADFFEYDGGILNSELPQPTDKNDLLIVTNIGGIQTNFDTSKWTNVMIDGAHAQYLDYESKLDTSEASSIIYSFFATKSTPIGEGGLIVTSDDRLHAYVISVLMYDRPFFISLGLNFRVSTSTYNKMLFLLNDDGAKEYLLTGRQTICNMYREVCENLSVKFVNFSYCNGYKFIITDPRIKSVGKFGTSKVFDLYDHICVATYPQLASSLDELRVEFVKILEESLNV